MNIPNEWHMDGYCVSTDRKRLDLKLIYEYLSGRSYWAKGRPLEIVRRSIENSLPFGLYEGEQQVGFARVVSDYGAFAWIADVFVLEPWRGRGLSKWLMGTIMSHPQLQGIQRWLLATQDAHELYRKFGFAELPEPSQFMTIRRDYNNLPG
jgi:GNAT superfamily N-acetyltransferase